MIGALPAAPASRLAGPTATVLIAGADAMTRTILAAMVSNVGFPLVTAATAGDACTAFTECAPDLVILCWDRSDFDALAVCRRVRETSGKHCFILLITYRDDKSDLVRGVAAGIDDFIRAPIQADQFRAHLVTAEERLQANRAKPRPPHVAPAMMCGRPLTETADQRPATQREK